MHKHTTDKPSKYVVIPCPCCSSNKRVINGQFLRYARERAGLDQRAFGKKVNASGPYISDIERNRRECPDDIFNAYMRLNG